MKTKKDFGNPPSWLYWCYFKSDSQLQEICMPDLKIAFANCSSKGYWEAVLLYQDIRNMKGGEC